MFDVQSVLCSSGNQAGQYHVLFSLFSKCLLRWGIAHYGNHHFPATWICFAAIEVVSSSTGRCATEGRCRRHANCRNHASCCFQVVQRTAVSVAVENKLYPVLIQHRSEGRSIDETFTPADRALHRWMVDQHDPKQPLFSRLHENLFQFLQLYLSNTADG